MGQELRVFFPLLPSNPRAAQSRCHLFVCSHRTSPASAVLNLGMRPRAEQQASPVHSDGTGDGTSHASEHSAAVMRSTWSLLLSNMNGGSNRVTSLLRLLKHRAAMRAWHAEVWSHPLRCVSVLAQETVFFSRLLWMKHSCTIEWTSSAFNALLSS